MAIDEHIHRFTTEEYWRMADAGVFDEVRVELLDGLVVDMILPGEEHARVIQELMGCYAGDYRMLRPQFPFEAADGWVPQLDFAIAQRNTDWRAPGRRRSPVAALLIAEVSVTTKRLDLRKAAVYAAAGVPVYWLIDVTDGVVLEHTEPAEDGYSMVRTLRGDDLLDAHVEGMAPITVARLLAP
jgi:Uma2 family endonuclease